MIPLLEVLLTLNYFYRDWEGLYEVSVRSQGALKHSQLPQLLQVSSELGTLHNPCVL